MVCLWRSHRSQRWRPCSWATSAVHPGGRSSTSPDVRAAPPAHGGPLLFQAVPGLSGEVSIDTSGSASAVAAGRSSRNVRAIPRRGRQSAERLAHGSATADARGRTTAITVWMSSTSTSSSVDTRSSTTRHPEPGRHVRKRGSPGCGAQNESRPDQPIYQEQGGAHAYPNS